MSVGLHPTHFSLGCFLDNFLSSHTDHHIKGVHANFYSIIKDVRMDKCQPIGRHKQNADYLDELILSHLGFNDVKNQS